MRLMLVLIVTKKDYLVAYCRSKVFQLGVIYGGRSWEGCYWHLVARCQEWNLASYKKLMSTATKVKKLCCKYMEYIYSIYICGLQFIVIVCLSSAYFYFWTEVNSEVNSNSYSQWQPAWIVMYIFWESNVITRYIILHVY